MVPRRSLLLAPAALLAPARPMLTLEQTDSRRLEACLALPSGAVFTCPARRARLVATLAMGAFAAPEPVSIVRFGADAGPIPQDVLAFVNAEGRLLALERATWQAADGTLDTRIAMLPDRRHITLSRVLAWRDTQWHHEAWTDYLRADHGRLVDAPQRPILEGTGQHRLIALRAAMQALLSPPPLGLTGEAMDLIRGK